MSLTGAYKGFVGCVRRFVRLKSGLGMREFGGPRSIIFRSWTRLLEKLWRLGWLTDPRAIPELDAARRNMRIDNKLAGSCRRAGLAEPEHFRAGFVDRKARALCLSPTRRETTWHFPSALLVSVSGSLREPLTFKPGHATSQLST